MENPFVCPTAPEMDCGYPTPQCESLLEKRVVVPYFALSEIGRSMGRVESCAASLVNRNSKQTLYDTRKETDYR